MRKRRGASLLNVMVFLMFSVMITAQVFFFSKSSSDSLAEEREIMVYRLNLNSLVEEAKDALKDENKITHIDGLHKAVGEPRTPDLALTPLKYYQFYSGTTLFSDDHLGTEWHNSGYHVRIHDLDYSFDQRGKDDGLFTTSDRTNWTENYSGSKKHMKLFAAMHIPVISSDVTRDPSGDITAVNRRYYLIRAWTQLPENFFNAKLMYQVLVRRDNDEAINTTHNVDVLSFQEVWY